MPILRVFCWAILFLLRQRNFTQKPLKSLKKTTFYAINCHIFTLFRKLKIGRKIVRNQRITPLPFREIFQPNMFNAISPKNHSNHCKTSFYGINCNISSSFRKLEICQKIVKSQRLTPLLFYDIFRPKLFNVISPKNHSNH